jgi:hypothetical protein
MNTTRKTVQYDGKTYSLRSNKTEPPDFDSMSRMAVLIWLNRYTVARGYHRDPGPNLTGLVVVAR